MDPKLVYWSLALANLGAIAGCLLAGVHRRAGRAAVVGCLLALVTAVLVLTGMYARAWA